MSTIESSKATINLLELPLAERYEYEVKMRNEIDEEYPSGSALSFNIDEKMVNSVYDLAVKPSPLANLVLARTYARVIEHKKSNDGSDVLIPIYENRKQVFTRVTSGVFTEAKNRMIKLNRWNPRVESYMIDFSERFFTHFTNLRFTPPGRGLWQHGAASRPSPAGLFNCSFMSTSLYDTVGVGGYYSGMVVALMNGVGVGHDDKNANKYKIYIPQESQELDAVIKECLLKDYRNMASSVKGPAGKTNVMTTVGREFKINNLKKKIAGTTDVEEMYNILDQIKNIQVEYELSVVEHEKTAYFLDEITRLETSKYGIIHVIEDSREGWGIAFAKLFDSFTIDGLEQIFFDYSNIRPEGSYLKKTGGSASGPAPVLEGISIIRSLFYRSYNIQTEEGVTYPAIRSIDMLDFANVLGRVSEFGGTRRSSQIFMGYNYETVFAAKDFGDESNGWNNTEIDYRRGWMSSSNNSLCITKEVMEDTEGFRKLCEKASDRIKNNGEPGFFFLDTAREYGLTSMPPNFKDKKAQGANPCCEQTLNECEMCCLAECHLSGFTGYSIDEVYDVMEEVMECMAFYSCITSSMLTGWKEVDMTKLANNRLGNSLTGIRDFIGHFGLTYDQFGRHCRQWRAMLATKVMYYADLLSISLPIKITSVKPSGSVSLLSGMVIDGKMICGTSPGIHCQHAPYYLRRVRINNINVGIADKMRDAGFPVEYILGENMWVVTYPVKSPPGITKKDLTLDDQLELNKILHENWADNQVSATITFLWKEGNMLADKIVEYSPYLKSMSFLCYMPGQYDHAPYEECTEAEYNRLMSNITHTPSLAELTSTITVENEEIPDKFCSGDSCMLVK